MYSLIGFSLFLSDLIEKLDGRLWADLLADSTVGTILRGGDQRFCIHHFHCVTGAVRCAKAAAIAALWVNGWQGKGIVHPGSLVIHASGYHPGTRPSVIYITQWVRFGSAFDLSFQLSMI
jgi:hypothetical protein